MLFGREHGRTKEGGRVLPFLYGWGGSLGSRPPQGGREQTLSSYHCCRWYPWHHCCCRDSAYMKGNSSLFGWDTVLHPSWPVIAAGEVPWPTTVLWVKRRVLQPTRTIPFSPPPKTPKALSPPRSPPLARALALVRPPHCLMASLGWLPAWEPQNLWRWTETRLWAWWLWEWYQTPACRAFPQAGWWKTMKWG